MHSTCAKGITQVPCCRSLAWMPSARPGCRTHFARQRRSLVAMGLGDRLLDYIEGGPKLRKWYGQGERPSDGGGMRGPQSEEPNDGDFDPDAPREAVLVTDADTPLGEFVVLQLILARVKTRVLVKNPQAAATAFGPYVTPVGGDVNSAPTVQKALQGARAAIVTGQPGPHLLRFAQQSGLEHIVLPSSAGAQQGGFDLFRADSALKDPKRETEIEASDIPHTIVRVGRVRNTPGGTSQLRFAANSSSSGGDVSREDLARILTKALDCPPAQRLSFTVASDGPGSPPDDLQEILKSLQAA